MTKDKMGFIMLISFAVLGIFGCIAVIVNGRRVCSESESTQQILSQIQEVQTSLERQLSELPLSVNCKK